jgi:hypothetical protein
MRERLVLLQNFASVDLGLAISPEARGITAEFMPSNACGGCGALELNGRCSAV